jgi:carboxypeptidase PM20D1
MTGASDSRFLSRVCDNCIRFVPFLISQEQMNSVHGIDENVDVATLAPAVDFYKFILKESGK